MKIAKILTFGLLSFCLVSCGGGSSSFFNFAGIWNVAVFFSSNTCGNITEDIDFPESLDNKLTINQIEGQVEIIDDEETSYSGTVSGNAFTATGVLDSADSESCTFTETVNFDSASENIANASYTLNVDCGGTLQCSISYNGSAERTS